MVARLRLMPLLQWSGFVLSSLFVLGLLVGLLG